MRVLSSFLSSRMHFTIFFIIFILFGFFSLSLFCRFVRLSSLQVSLICITANRLFFAHLLNGSEISQYVVLCIYLSACMMWVSVFVRAFIYSYYEYALHRMSQLRPIRTWCIQKWTEQTGKAAATGSRTIGHHTVNHKPFWVCLFYFFRFFCSFALAQRPRVSSNSKNKTHNSHSCFNFNIYIYDPIKIVTLDLHLRARAHFTFAFYTCKLLWFTCDCAYVVRHTLFQFF